MPTAYVPSSQAHRTAAPHVRWMVAGDLDRLVSEAETGTTYPWSREDLFGAIRNNHRCVGLVVEPEFDRMQEPGPVGYMIYTLADNKVVTVDRIAVAPSFRRRGYGSALLQRLQDRQQSRGRSLRAIVRESDLDLQLFFKAHGFLAQPEIRRCYFEDTGEDGYEMTYTSWGVANG